MVNSQGRPRIADAHHIFPISPVYLLYISPVSRFRPQHGASGSRKDLTGGRGTVEGHFTFTLLDRATEEAAERQRATAGGQRETAEMQVPDGGQGLG